jgi:hypothetical protein
VVLILNLEKKSGSYTSENTSNYMTVLGGLSETITFSVVASSDGLSFEFDNVAAAVPELSTWTMMILGFFGLGYLACRRKSLTPAAAKA